MYNLQPTTVHVQVLQLLCSLLFICVLVCSVYTSSLFYTLLQGIHVPPHPPPHPPSHTHNQTHAAVQGCVFFCFTLRTNCTAILSESLSSFVRVSYCRASQTLFILESLFVLLWLSTFTAIVSLFIVFGV
jgi:hypothetical protein